jgi:hypothetical protein
MSSEYSDGDALSLDWFRKAANSITKLERVVKKMNCIARHATAEVELKCEEGAL